MLGSIFREKSSKHEGDRLSYLRLIGIFGILAGSILARPFAADGDLFGRIYGPKGRLLVSKPTFVWEVWSNDPGEIVGARASVGEWTLAARYDVARRRIVAETAAPLPSGTYPVKVAAVLRDGEVVTKSWEVAVSADARSSLAPPSESQRKTFDAVNLFRANLGLPPCRMDDTLNAVALLHSNYLARNNTTGHYESPDKPGYFGREPGERLESFSFVEDSWETIEFGALDEIEAIANLTDAPYHRLAYMQPGAPRFGSGLDTQRLTALFSMEKEEGTVVHPSDRQTGVKTRWTRNERPSPLRIHPDVRHPVGYPIVLAHFGPGMPRLNVRLAKLTDENEVDVPIHLNTPENDSEIRNATFLIPKRPLAPRTTYFVRVEASVENGPDVSRIWRFTTGPQ